MLMRSLYVRTMDDRKPEYAEVIRAQGAEFHGIQFGPLGASILFVDPKSRATLILSEGEFSPDAVSRRLQESRQAFDLDSHVQKSLC
jgi:hypothetical protein